IESEFIWRIRKGVVFGFNDSDGTLVNDNYRGFSKFLGSHGFIHSYFATKALRHQVKTSTKL
ncbi:MAG: hypothetical protein ACREOB_03225, partial [Thermodesulfobacteriota bacterium]